MWLLLFSSEPRFFSINNSLSYTQDEIKTAEALLDLYKSNISNRYAFSLTTFCTL
jgi:hypothetical protein